VGQLNYKKEMLLGLTARKRIGTQAAHAAIPMNTACFGARTAGAWLFYRGALSAFLLGRDKNHDKTGWIARTEKNR
jgi:hypothetical protein